MEALHEVLDIDLDESKLDIRRYYTSTEILNAVLTYDGLIGYADIMIRWIKEIYGVDLEEIED